MAPCRSCEDKDLMVCFFGALTPRVFEVFSLNADYIDAFNKIIFTFCNYLCKPGMVTCKTHLIIGILRTICRHRIVA